MDLSWNAAAGATGYKLYRANSVVKTLDAATRTTTDTGLTAGTLYTYTVTATNSGGESPKSATVNATTLAERIKKGE